MDTIIFIGVNKSGSSREAIKAAARLGYYTVLFTDRQKQLSQREQYPDVHQMILTDIMDTQEMEKQIKKLQHRGHEVCLITSFTDRHVHTASLLADRYCHNILSTESIGIMESKEKTRTFFKDEPFTPNFFLLPATREIEDINLEQNVTFPVVIKPPQSTGSKDALMADNTQQLKYHVDALREVYPNDTFIIEEFIEGDQYLVEAVVFQSQLTLVAVIEQEITKGERFIITGYGVITDVDLGLERDILKVTEGVVSKLNIKNSAMHIEMRRGKTGMKLIEVNPRISGSGMNDMIQAAFGYSLVEETLKLYLNQEPSLKKQRNLSVYTKHLVVSKSGILEKVTGRGRARRSEGVVKVYVKPKKGTLLKTPRSMGHRYAYVITATASLERAEQLAVKAANEIEFHINEGQSIPSQQTNSTSTVMTTDKQLNSITFYQINKTPARRDIYDNEDDGKD